MNSADIRRAFLAHFEQRDHEVVASAPLVPKGDDTLLFTNAGMVPFKEVFTGVERRQHPRAVSSQQCVRAGGKHNDLDNVGFTTRHHTFFEMLGNFSFGDYGKREAIEWSWELLTQTFGMDDKRLIITVHNTDDEAAAIWHTHMGVPRERIIRLGDNSNFWQMGPTGPCGPCSEIFFDHGHQVSGGPPGHPDEDGDRFTEIWNLVFMQYDQTETKRIPLPNPCIDTGMGLERISAALQGTHDNFRTDLFMPLLQAAHAETDSKAPDSPQLRVMADHARAVVFLLAAGVSFNPDGRGYVLRRILRRALRAAHKVGRAEASLIPVIREVIALMQDAYPEVQKLAPTIEQAVTQEEDLARETLARAAHAFQKERADMSSDVMSGDRLFYLYDTLGMPLDLAQDLAQEHDIRLDMAQFDSELAQQRARAKSDRAEAGSRTATAQQALTGEQPTEFMGYDATSWNARVTRLLTRGMVDVKELPQGALGCAILDQTPFYAEGGGQAGDHGILRTGDGVRVEVSDCRKVGDVYVHDITTQEGVLTHGRDVFAQVDPAARREAASHHSATHLLYSSLRELFPEHDIQQRGSSVSSEGLRFDFTAPQQITAEQLIWLEDRVNEHIRAAVDVTTDVMNIQAARASGAHAQFDEKYGDTVRVLTMGIKGISKEFCGGTHVANTRDCLAFVITEESAIASGVRRITALAGDAAIAHLRRSNHEYTATLKALSAKPGTLEERVTELRMSLKKARAQAKKEAMKPVAPASSVEREQVAGVWFEHAIVPDADGAALRAMADQIRSKDNTVGVLIGTFESKAVATISVASSLLGRISAKDLSLPVFSALGGKGGGRPDLVQGGGTQPQGAEQAVAAARTWLAAQSDLSPS